MTRILMTTTWIGLIILVGWGTSTAHASIPASSYTLGALPGSWHRAVQTPLGATQLRPRMRHVRWSGAQETVSRSSSAMPGQGDALGTLQQSQTAPPPQFGFPPPGSPGFYLFIIDISMLVGSLAVNIGGSIAASMNADLTGWKVAGLVLDGIGLASSIGMIATLDMSQLPAFFSIIVYVSLGLSALSLIWGSVKLGMYIHQRNKMKEREMREGQPEKPKGPPVVILPWGGVDKEGNPVGGLAMVGQF